MTYSSFSIYRFTLVMKPYHRKHSASCVFLSKVIIKVKRDEACLAFDFIIAFLFILSN